MALSDWKPSRASISTLYLDNKNPRLGPAGASLSQREIIQFLFDHEKALEVARSISRRGFFPTEGLVAVRDTGRLVVVEGNRRLAASKALREPDLIEGTASRAIRELSSRADKSGLLKLPITVAPSRRETDALVAARHGGTAIEAWDAEKRASFIVEKLQEGYDDAELVADLGFTTDQISEARLVYSLAKIVRGLDLPTDVREKLNRPRMGILSTLKRVVEFPSGRKHLRLTVSAEHGLVGQGSPVETKRALSELVSDLARREESSRTLNTDALTDQYFTERNPGARVQRRGTGWQASDLFAPEEESAPPPTHTRQRYPKRASLTVLPTSLRPRHGSVRVMKMRDELTKIRRDRFPNAGAVGLRVFFELVVVDYLKRTDALEPLKTKLAKGGTYPRDLPPMQDLLQAVREIAKARLDRSASREVLKALADDKHARFTVNDLHSFVHSSASLPTDGDLEQFWIRTEPLFRLMLESEIQA